MHWSKVTVQNREPVAIPKSARTVLSYARRQKTVAWNHHEGRSTGMAVPRCKKGMLVPLSNTFVALETAGSKEAHDHEAWDQEWINERFICVLQCTWKGCGETAVAAGHAVVAVSVDEHGESWYHRYRPDFLEPAPDMFTVPADTPENIRSEVQEAFRLFWTDLPACANRIRTAVESVLTFLAVPTTMPGGGYMSAHSRIVHYKGMNPANVALADVMLAVKWLGNAGSHTGSVKEKDIFDGFDLLEHVLYTLSPPNVPNLTALAQSINAARGPVP